MALKKVRSRGVGRRSRWASVVGLGALLALLASLVYLSPAAQAATTTVKGVGSGRCLDVPNANSIDGTQLIIWDCNGAGNQTFTTTSSNELQALGKCVDADNNGRSAGTRVILWSCNGGANQQWRVNSNGTITGVASGLCLEVAGGSTAGGALIRLGTCQNASHQQWATSVGTTPTTAPTTGPGGDRGLHVEGKYLVDGNGDRVVFRAVEHILRWGNYAGSANIGDVPWEGGANDSTGAQLDEIVKSGTNSVRLFGGLPNELDSVLNKAIVQHKLWVSIGRINWENQTNVNTLKKYGKYLTLHVRGEFQSDDEAAWERAAISDITKIRALGLTSPIEVQPVGYGQRLGAILRHGDAIMNADPLRNVVFSYQLYSELANDIDGALNSTASYQHPIWVGTCLFQGGINAGYGNDANTYKKVWDGSGSRQLSSLVWSWSGDGEGNNMTTNGRYDSLTAVGQYVINQSPYSMKRYAPKTPYLLNARV